MILKKEYWVKKVILIQIWKDNKNLFEDHPLKNLPFMDWIKMPQK